MSKYYLKALKRLKKSFKRSSKKKLNQLLVLSTHSLNPYTYLTSLNDGTGDVLHSFSIVSSPVNEGIKSYWSKVVEDRSNQQKLVDLEIFDPTEPALLGCIRISFNDYIMSILTLQKPTNFLILPALYLLTSLISLMGLQRH